MVSEIKPPFTNLQMELIKLFSLEIPDEDLIQLKSLIARFLMDKARQEATEIAQQRGYTEDTYRNWAANNAK